jgi:hypothetical protein
MSSHSIIPNDRLHRDFYLVLKDFKGSAAFRETDEGITYISLIDDLLTGQYGDVQRILPLNPVEGWSRDASEDIAGALEAHTAAEGREVCECSRDFIGQLGRAGKAVPDGAVWIHEVKYDGWPSPETLKCQDAIVNRAACQTRRQGVRAAELRGRGAHLPELRG